MKKKTYVLTVSESFPKSHPKAGELTHFVDKIASGDKIHTIRKNSKLWANRAEKINSGEAVLSVRVWTGKPYRSKQKEVFSFDKIGTEFINVKKKHKYDIYTLGNTFAKNDGLSVVDFNNWFDFRPDEVYIIIHFTGFRYSRQDENN